MTTVTIPEAILSLIKPGEQAVEVHDAAGVVQVAGGPCSPRAETRASRGTGSLQGNPGHLQHWTSQRQPPILNS